MRTPELDTLSEMIRHAAKHELLPRFARIHQDFKSDGSIVTEADYRMQQSLQHSLHETWPHIAFLGEEMPLREQEKVLSAPGAGVWIVDPLDGSSNFSLGIPFFAVSLALLLDGQIELGIVYDPVRDECFSAQRGCGARLNHQRLDLETLRRVDHITIGLVDFKRLERELVMKLTREPPYRSQRSFGSVALDWCWLAAGRYHVYLHGKQKIWDYAAGSLILAEVGGYALTLDGEEVFKPDVQPRSVFAALDEDLFKQWHSYLRV
jgi:myo-inositol-1(or 4)-monophosphatase